MITGISITLVLLALFGASLLVERLLGRSRKEMQKPGWYAVFFILFVPAIYAVYALIPLDSPFLYAAYAASGGVAALFAQVFFGVKLPKACTPGGQQ